jgi:hypothetical protein
MKLLQFLLPKDRIFYLLLEKIGSNIHTVSDLFGEFITATKPKEKELIFKQIKKIERENDDLTQEVSIELGRNFITPFDREDIHNLTNALDEVINYIYAASKKIMFYQIDTTKPAIIDSFPPIQKSCLAIEEAIFALRELKNSAKMEKCLKQISKAEKAADDLFDESITFLFDKTEDMKELIKKREVYKYLETITDQCKAAGKILGSISIKYA